MSNLPQRFHSIAEERITADDAVRIGLPDSWARDLIGRLGEGGSVSARSLGDSLDDPSVRDLLEYCFEQASMKTQFADVAGERLSLHDAVVAGVVPDVVLSVGRELFGDASAEVTIADLLPYARRPILADLLGWTAEGREPDALAAVLRARDERLRLEQSHGAVLGATVKMDEAIQAGGACDGLPATAARWFGEGTDLSVQHLLLARHDGDFARLLDWRLMLAGRGPVETSRAAHC